MAGGRQALAGLGRGLTRRRHSGQARQSTQHRPLATPERERCPGRHERTPPGRERRHGEFAEVRLLSTRQDAGHEGGEPPVGGDALADGGDDTGAGNVHDGGPLGAQQANRTLDQHAGVGPVAERGCDLERHDGRVLGRSGQRPHVLDVDPVDLCDLLQQEVQELRIGDVDDEFVDRSARATLDDVDADDVAADGTDPACDGAEGARSVGQPDTEHEGGHGRTLVGPRVGTVSRACRTRGHRTRVPRPAGPSNAWTPLPDGMGPTATVPKVTTSATPSRRLTARGEERRAQIIEFATARFAADGYHATSVADIVNGLGVGKGVFYWYFDSKEQLFLEILKDAQRDLRRTQQRATAGVDDPIRRIALGVRAGVVWTVGHGELRRLVDFARTEATFAAAVRAGQRVLTRDAMAQLQEAMDTGRIPVGDGRALASGLLGVTTTMTDALVEEGRVDAGTIADLVTDFCLRGIGADPV